MAKKSNPTKDSAKAAKEVPAVVKVIDEQFARGNFAGVRQLASRTGDLDEESRRHVEALLEKTKTDPRAWLIGAGALVVVLIVAAMTLTG